MASLHSVPQCFRRCRVHIVNVGVGDVMPSSPKTQVKSAHAQNVYLRLMGFNAAGEASHNQQLHSMLYHPLGQRPMQFFPMFSPSALASVHAEHAAVGALAERVAAYKRLKGDIEHVEDEIKTEKDPAAKAKEEEEDRMLKQALAAEDEEQKKEESSADVEKENKELQAKIKDEMEKEHTLQLEREKEQATQKELAGEVKDAGQALSQKLHDAMEIQRLKEQIAREKAKIASADAARERKEAEQAEQLEKAIAELKAKDQAGLKSAEMPLLIPPATGKALEEATSEKKSRRAQTPPSLIEKALEDLALKAAQEKLKESQEEKEKQELERRLAAANAKEAELLQRQLSTSAQAQRAVVKERAEAEALAAKQSIQREQAPLRAEASRDLAKVEAELRAARARAAKEEDAVKREQTEEASLEADISRNSAAEAALSKRLQGRPVQTFADTMGKLKINQLAKQIEEERAKEKHVKEELSKEEQEEREDEKRIQEDVARETKLEDEIRKEKPSDERGDAVKKAARTIAGMLAKQNGLNPSARKEVEMLQKILKEHNHNKNVILP